MNHLDQGRAGIGGQRSLCSSSKNQRCKLSCEIIAGKAVYRRFLCPLLRIGHEGLLVISPVWCSDRAKQLLKRGQVGAVTCDSRVAAGHISNISPCMLVPETGLCVGLRDLPADLDTIRPRRYSRVSQRRLETRDVAKSPATILLLDTQMRMSAACHDNIYYNGPPIKQHKMVRQPPVYRSCTSSLKTGCMHEFRYLEDGKARQPYGDF